MKADDSNSRSFGEWLLFGAVLLILVFVALPELSRMEEESVRQSEAGVTGAVRAGLTMYYVHPEKGKNRYFPPALDDVAPGEDCSRDNPCFDHIMTQGGVRAEWSKPEPDVYTGPTGTSYRYDSESGQFDPLDGQEAGQ